MTQSPPDRDWTVLLIGGGPLTGKSTLASQLGTRLGLRVLEADLFSMVLNRGLPEARNPGVQLFAASETLTVAELTQRYLQHSAFVCDALQVVVADRLAARIPAILEGSPLLPSLAVQRDYAVDKGQSRRVTADKGSVRSLFLFEDSLEELQERMKLRYGSSWINSNPWQRYAAMHHAYGLEIKAQAEALNLPVLESRPFDTLLDRALAALNRPPS